MVPRAFGQTDRGVCRKRNEDALGIAGDLSLFIIADGIGGRPAGEVASRMAVETIDRYIRKPLSGPDPVPGDNDPNRSAMANRLVSAVHAANQAILLEAKNNPSRNGMGTTVAAAWCVNNRAYIAHVGDSRVYLLRDTLRQVTEDHTLVAELLRQGVVTREEAEQSPRKNIITRALGLAAEIEVDLTEIELRVGDRLLLCTDGLTAMVPDAVIRAVLSAYPAQVAGKNLVNLACQSGGHDNITVILVCFDPGNWRSKLKKKIFTKEKEQSHAEHTDKIQKFCSQDDRDEQGPAHHRPQHQKRYPD
jgi:PPM family protein phosphatase